MMNCTDRRSFKQQVKDLPYSHRLHYQALIVLLVLPLLASCSPELTARPAEQATPTVAPTRPPYNTDTLKTVERRDLVDSVTGRATVAPKKTDALFFRRDGRIGTVDVVAGDEVKQGQVLARLEQADLLYQIGLARIDVEIAELHERTAREQQVSSAELAIAGKQVERARLAFERLETEQKSLLVTAPYPGRITELAAAPGAEIVAYQPVVTIVGTEELIILAEFSGPKAGRVVLGQAVELRDFLDDQLRFMGSIAGKPDAGGTTMIVEPQEGTPPLQLGDSLEVVATLGRAEDVLTLPAAAVKTIGDRRYVLLVDQGELRRVFVQTGLESDGLVEIASGLEAGQQISER